MPYGDNTALKYDPFEEIYALRYEAYLDNGSINPNKDALTFDKYDYQANCFSHMEHIKGAPAGSIRACVYSPEAPVNAIPIFENFGDEIDAALGMNEIIVEANKFAIKPARQFQMFKMKFRLFQFIFEVAQEANARFIVGAIKPHQTQFYELLGFKIASEIKHSRYFKFSTYLMICDVEDARQFIRDHTKYFDLTRLQI